MFGSSIITLALVRFPRYFITVPFRGLNILFLSINIESVGSISAANLEISSLLKSLSINDNVAFMVAPISAVELAIPFPTGILLFIFKEIFLVSFLGKLNFSNTFSIANLDLYLPKFISTNFSSIYTLEYISIAYEHKYSSSSIIPCTNSPQDAGHIP
ncbi:Uncharacterised protein [Clostridioides difficile]|nr:Uncharacterised protein [Clostridioides difficile]